MTFNILMGVTFALAIWAYRKGARDSVSWGRPVAFVAIALTVCFAAARVIGSLTHESRASERWLNDRLEKNAAYNEVCLRRLSRHLVEHFPGRRVLVLGKRQAVNNDRYEQQIRELLVTRSVDQVEIAGIEYPAFTGTTLNEQTIRPPDFTRDADAMASDFDEIIGRYKHIHVVISLVGLPPTVFGADFWSIDEEKRPKVIVKVPSDQVGNLRRAVDYGYISTVITDRPGFSFRQNIASDLNDAFNQRYLMIMDENIDRIAAEHPVLFRFSKFADPEPESEGEVTKESTQ